MSKKANPKRLKGDSQWPRAVGREEHEATMTICRYGVFLLGVMKMLSLDSQDGCSTL